MAANDAIMTIGPDLTCHDRIDHLSARVGHRRMDHKIAPGLYRLGTPDGSSPVFVSSNYTLSFDALRSSLKGTDCYILVLDTKGVNVWCAAGKGTFGTEEIIRKVKETGLADVVDHRQIILPQLGAPGVMAHVVKKNTGFSVVYGPVRARDLPEYLRLGQATTGMRRVTFPWRDRAVLVPVEIKQSLKYLLPAMLLLFLVNGVLAAVVALVAVLGGALLFPLLLPFLPTREFSSKGMVLGSSLSLLFIPLVLMGGMSPVWAKYTLALSLPFLMAPVVGYIALNFTGASTFTSRTGVKNEIFRWIPVMAGMMIVGLALLMISASAYWGWY